MSDLPILAVNKPSHRTTINGVPLDRLHGHLPPPIGCDTCGYPLVWFLIDPDVQRAGSDEPGELVMVAEYSLTCVDPEMREIFGAMAVAPTCGHPFHLVPHKDCEPGRGESRLIPVIPPGLIARV